MSEPIIGITNHACVRAEQRMGIQPREALALSQQAWRRGKILDDFKGKQRKWLESRLASTGREGGRIICVLEGFAYVFSSNLCITIIKMPE